MEVMHFIMTPGGLHVLLESVFILKLNASLVLREHPQCRT